MKNSKKVKEVPVNEKQVDEAQLYSHTAQRVCEADLELACGFDGVAVLHKATRSETPLLEYIDQVRFVQDGVDRLRNLCYILSRNAGWHTSEQLGPQEVAVKIALIHSELSEALEGVRKNKADDHLPNRSALEVELADAVIRIADLAGAMKLDLGGAIIEKLVYNQKRQDHKLEARNGCEGKRF